ncbi:MAG: Shikimate dehydrogenase (NADP(+)) [Verrucomicrobiae bacterium]|nr:Shikimate dehydrogenase (NADP(+)) [Verrucomicrobiae bacterium]
MQIDGSTQIVGVFGAPITHTASPAMHNAAFAALEMNWTYLAFHVEPPNLRQALFGVRDMNFRGVNLTIPHKILALDIVDEVDAEARRLGAVNTVTVAAGKLRGFNTDGYGFAKALKEEFDLSLKGKRVLVMGAGGAGRAIAIKCAIDGAAKIVVANRTSAKLSPIAHEIGKTKTAFESIKLNEVAAALANVDLLVNATAVGLNEGEGFDLPDAVFTPALAVYDTIYRPAETALLRQAARAGAKTSNGLSMLLHQGAKAFEIWTGLKAPLPVMRRALRAAVYGETT